jgi:hypothetical protein
MRCENPDSSPYTVGETARLGHVTANASCLGTSPVLKFTPIEHCRTGFLFNPNPTLSGLDTLAAHSLDAPSDIVSLQRWGLPFGPPLACDGRLVLVDARAHQCPDRSTWFHTSIAGVLFSHLLLLAFSVKQLRNSAALAPQ